MLTQHLFQQSQPQHKINSVNFNWNSLGPRYSIVSIYEIVDPIVYKLKPTGKLNTTQCTYTKTNIEVSHVITCYDIMANI